MQDQLFLNIPFTNEWTSTYKNVRRQPLARVRIELCSIKRHHLYLPVIATQRLPVVYMHFVHYHVNV